MAVPPLRSFVTALRSHRWWTTAAGIALVVLACLQSVGQLQLPPVDTLDRLVQDQRVRWRAPAVAPSRVVIVDIDEKSLAEQGRWTWPRAKLAELVRRVVDEGGARVFGFDMLFAEPQPGEDALLADAIRGRPVVLGYYFSSDEGGLRTGRLPTPLFPASALAPLQLSALAWDGHGANLEALTQAARAGGFFNARVDDDGVVRSVPLLSSFDGELYESLAVAVLRLDQGGAPVALHADRLAIGQDVTLPFADDLTARIPFAGPLAPGAGRLDYVSATDVLGGRVDPARFRDRIVLLGASAHGIGDRQATPVHHSTPGVALHAALIDGALRGDTPYVPRHAGLAMALLTALLGLAAALALPRLGAFGIAAATSALLVLLFAANHVAYVRGDWILPIAMAALTIVALAVMNLAVGHFVEGKARRAVIDLFGQYVSPELVKRMARRPQDYPIESQNKRLTILFADVRGFTRIAESMDPQALREYLNRFLTRMTEVIHQHGGTVDKYMGDAIMAFWGAPIDDPEQEDHAVAAALEMQAAVMQLNEEFELRRWPLLAIGVGVNSGTARVGDMGSQLRRTYTAIGDSVNLAARLESLTKRFGVPVLIGDSTARGVTRVRLTALGETDVPGRNERVRVHTPQVFVQTVPRRVPERIGG
ncbi:MAG: CHASE2 domain-containing protein [Lautropia sp.]